MNSARYLLLALLAPLACARSVDADDDETTGDTSSALLAHANTLWPMKDGTATIRVCWRPLNLGDQFFPGPEYTPDFDEVMSERRQWIQETVEQQWNGRTVVKFVGWKPCGTEPVDIEIDPISSDVVPNDNCSRGQPCVDDFGTRGRGKSVHINVLFGDEAVAIAHYKRANGTKSDPNKITPNVRVPALCLAEAKAAIQTPTQANEDAFVAEWKRCLQNSALHEFGHVTGFAHEWYRTDDKAKQKACLDDQGATDLPPPGSPADTPLGPFDSESIMSYCRHEKAATLTKEDIEQTNDVYTRLAPKADSGEAATNWADSVTTASKRKSKDTTEQTVSVGGCNGG